MSIRIREGNNFNKKGKMENFFRSKHNLSLFGRQDVLNGLTRSNYIPFNMLLSNSITCGSIDQLKPHFSIFYKQSYQLQRLVT